MTERQVIQIRAGATDVPRRHASVFLKGGTYLLTLLEPPGKPSSTDLRAWTAWKEGGASRPWLSEFSVFSPGLNGGVPQSFAGERLIDRNLIVNAFNRMPTGSRTLTVKASGPFGHPVMFYINDEKDDDNRGGLTIEISRVITTED